MKLETKSKIATPLILIFGVLCLSTSAIFVKLADAPSSITAFYRLFFTFLMLAPFAVSSKSARRELAGLSGRQWGMCLISGVLLAIHYILWFESLIYTSVASSTVLVTLQPIFSILLAYFFLKDRLKRAQIVSCLIAIGGSFIIGWGDFQTGSSALFGDGMALAAAAFIRAYFFIGQIARKKISVILYSVLSYFSSVLFLAVYALSKQDAFFSYSGNTWLCFLGLAVISTIFGQFVFNILLKWVPATTISMSILGEPIGTCFLAYFILSESITLQQGLGIAVVLGGLGLFFFFQNKGANN